MTSSAQTDSQAQASQPNDAAALNACTDWMVAAIPANDRWENDRGQNDRAAMRAPVGNVVAFKSRTGEERQSRLQTASPSAPTLPEHVGEQDRLAPPVTRRVHRSLTAPLLIGASLLCHALALAYFSGHAPPAIAIGERPVLADLVTGISAASGISGEASVDSNPVAGARADHTPPRDEPDLQSSKPHEMAAPVSAAKKLPPQPESKMSAPAKQPRHQVREKQDSARHAAISTPASAQTSQAARQSAAASGTNYAGQVARHLQRFKRYPLEARARGVSGIASVAFSVNGAGNAQGIRLVRSSGHAILDQEAVAMVQRASPFPTPPNGQAGPFTMPAGFSLR